MDWNTFKNRLEEVENVNKIENAYSHIIYDLFYNEVWDKQELREKYMLVDVSTYKRSYKGKPKNVELLGNNLCAVPDFVITDRVTKIDKISRFGVIEIKLSDGDASGTDRLLDSSDGAVKGYLSVYNNHVIYTNGWLWYYYDRNDKGELITKNLANFRENHNEEYYQKFITNLREIKWDK